MRAARELRSAKEKEMIRVQPDMPLTDIAVLVGGAASRSMRVKLGRKIVAIHYNEPRLEMHVSWRLAIAEKRENGFYGKQLGSGWAEVTTIADWLQTTGIQQ